MDDDKVLCIGRACEHAARSNFRVIVPGFPEHLGVCGLFHKQQRVVSLDGLELVATGLGDDIAVGASLRIQIQDIRAERVVVLLQLGGNVANLLQGAAADIDRFGVLVYLGIVAVFHKLEGEAARKRGSVRHIHQNFGAGKFLFYLQDGVSFILGIELLLVREFHLQEFVSQRLLLGGGQQVAFVVPLHGNGQDAAQAVELEGISTVTGRHDVGVGGGELAVEEAVLEVVGQGRRVRGIQRAAAVFPLVRVKVVHGNGGRFAVGGNVSGREGHGYLVFGIFAVHHNLVAGHPGGLHGRRGFFALLQNNFGEDEGERAGFRLDLGSHGLRSNRLLAAGRRQGQDAKDRYFIDCLHNQMHLKVLCVIRPSSSGPCTRTIRRWRCRPRLRRSTC